MPFVEQMTDPSPSDQPSLIQEMTIKGCEPHNGYDCGPTQNQKKFSSWAGHNLETVFYKECLLGETETERRSFTNFHRPGKGTFHWPENGGTSLRIANVNLEHKKHDFNLKSFRVSLSYHHFPAHE